jgi:ribose/xylose/arabinose/galactoside ABC-type transport system permease subunit
MVGKLPLAGLFLIGLYVAFYIILRFTYFGRKLFVIGGNIEAAKALGIDVSRTLLFTYILSGLIAAAGGWIHGGRINMAASHMSTNQLFLAFGAAVMGGVRLGGGAARLSGMFGGVILLALINTLMNLSKIDIYIIQATTGFIILLAMLIDALKSGAFLTARN